MSRSGRSRPTHPRPKSRRRPRRRSSTGPKSATMEVGDMKASRKPRKKKKLFTPAEANAALPLVTAIVQDIAALAKSLHERQERLARLGPPNPGGLSDPYPEELQQIQTELESHG